jgi:hypothetical protein
MKKRVSILLHLFFNNLIGTSEKAKWEEFKAKYYSQEFDEVLERFTAERIPVAHPTQFPDQDSPPEPRELSLLVQQMYNRNKETQFRANADKLISNLDAVTRLLQKDILFNFGSMDNFLVLSSVYMPKQCIKKSKTTLLHSPVSFALPQLRTILYTIVAKEENTLLIANA